ncbi:ATP-binding cassette domain-containing protein [Ectothiorhodospira haloalkaliphila]|uniref:ATP-binding cassette domain-containing protein n=1 Tax=Ectothiorhodospira haloalkaliphila TaxID=421628 RepID=UPI001EE931E0|nr:ATP-binding cassette domain-containing protein [Ectothiorhodospira haloalkaliphila]MCG5525209.1 ATP-binding cassette domain-containing protein [Ectothiorhodospira haloalkaliphila]
MDTVALTDDFTTAQTADGPHIARACRLLKRYDGQTVVDHIDLEVRPGECFGLLGPNGAGKSTTLRMMLGLTPPDGGTLHVLGEPIPARAREARVRLGIVPQFDNLDPDFTVRENLTTYAGYFGLKGDARRRRVDELIAFANLGQRENMGIDSLSGGMKRRLTLARALINRPELVVLDEPTTGLDPQARHHIWQCLRGLKQQGTTLILTTHYMEEAERLCDRLAIMDRGRIVAQDSPNALIAEHIDPHVLEINGNAAMRWLDGQTDDLPARAHRVGDMALLYCREAAPVLERLERAGLRYLHRPANLEDVFMKLTGHELRD